jgi:acyl carrier protein
VLVELLLNVEQQVVAVIDQTLGLAGRGATFDRGTPLLGAVPELDSMAVASLINALEERFGFTIDDDEIEGSTFATVGSLVSFVENKIS